MPNKIAEIRRGNPPSPQALSRKRVVIWVILIFSIFLNIFQLISLHSLSDLTTPVEPIGMEADSFTGAAPPALLTPDPITCSLSDFSGSSLHVYDGNYCYRVVLGPGGEFGQSGHDVGSCVNYKAHENLGKYDRTTADGKVMDYEGGSGSCHQGGGRVGSVGLEFDSLLTKASASVNEPEPCHYTIVIQTPSCKALAQDLGLVFLRGSKIISYAKMVNDNPNVNNITNQPKTGNVVSYGRLGLAKCPWMTIPKSSRYPRNSETIQPKPGSTSKFHTCLKALNDEWQKNTIRYSPIGGFLLSAIARGQFHGHSNDLDLDNIIVGEASAKRIPGCSGMHLGNWGAVWDKKIFPNQTYLNDNPTTIFKGDVPLCECEMWDLRIPCMVDTVEYLQWDYGPSWWFPVPSSKGTGWRIIDRIVAKNPRQGSSWKTFDQNVFKFLQDMDKDGDMSITMSEFATAVMSNKDLNLNWVKYQVQNNPCIMIDNARCHFNGMLGFFDRYLSGNIEGARQFMGDIFDAFANTFRFVSTDPYKYLPRHMFNLEENEVCATAVETEFRKHGLFEK